MKIILLLLACFAFSFDTLEVPITFQDSALIEASDFNDCFDSVQNKLNRTQDTTEKKFVRFTDFNDSVFTRAVLTDSVVVRKSVSDTFPLFKASCIDKQLKHILENYANSSNRGSLVLYRFSRGTTFGTRTVTQPTDMIGQVFGMGVDSSGNWAYASGMALSQDGEASTNKVPSKIVFYTGTATATTAEKMRISRNGRVGIGTTDTTAILMLGNGGFRSSRYSDIMDSMKVITGGPVDTLKIWMGGSTTPFKLAK